MDRHIDAGYARILGRDAAEHGAKVKALLARQLLYMPEQRLDDELGLGARQ